MGKAVPVMTQIDVRAYKGTRWLRDGLGPTTLCLTFVRSTAALNPSRTWQARNLRIRWIYVIDARGHMARVEPPK